MLDTIHLFAACFKLTQNLGTKKTKKKTRKTKESTKTERKQIKKINANKSKQEKS